MTSPFPQVIINAGSPHKFDNNIISALKQKIPLQVFQSVIKWKFTRELNNRKSLHRI